MKIPVKSLNVEVHSFQLLSHLSDGRTDKSEWSNPTGIWYTAALLRQREE